jgi:hypothetical protein
MQADMITLCTASLGYLIQRRRRCEYVWSGSPIIGGIGAGEWKPRPGGGGTGCDWGCAWEALAAAAADEVNASFTERLSWSTRSERMRWRTKTDGSVPASAICSTH